jgi:hypothetical protein
MAGREFDTRLAWHELARSDSKNDYGIEINGNDEFILHIFFCCSCCDALLCEIGVTSL